MHTRKRAGQQENSAQEQSLPPRPYVPLVCPTGAVGGCRTPSGPSIRNDCRFRVGAGNVQTHPNLSYRTAELSDNPLTAVLLFRWPAGRLGRPACCLIIERVASVLGASMAFDSVSDPARCISSNGQYGGYGQTDGCVVVR